MKSFIEADDQTFWRPLSKSFWNDRANKMEDGIKIKSIPASK